MLTVKLVQMHCLQMQGLQKLQSYLSPEPSFCWQWALSKRGRIGKKKPRKIPGLSTRDGS